MKFYSLTLGLLTWLAIALSPALAAEQAQTEESARQAANEASRAEYEELMKQAELTRKEAQEEAQEAQAAAHRHAEQVQQEAEEHHAARAEQSDAQAEQRALQAEEAALMREQLSRTHRELRDVSREVAQAHRELARATGQTHIVQHVNLGDRAVIGVILGRQLADGVEIIGVSPDGPAERGGMHQGDIVTSIQDVDLAEGGQNSGRDSIYRVMNDVSDGEELTITVMRNSKLIDLTITAEQREPTAWQSVIRIPEVGDVPAAPGDHEVIIKQIVVPEIDEVALAAEVEALEEKVRHMEYVFISPDGEGYDLSGEWEMEFEEMSQFGEHALREANIWFGLPHAQGLELTSINPGLGEYFKTDRGVLVIKAKEDNAYTLKSGDVVLEIDTTSVNTPADMMRALRALESGMKVDIVIKRERRDKTLKVVVPENRLSFDSSAHKIHP